MQNVDGVNGILLSVGSILVVQHAYGEKKYALPGGGVDKKEGRLAALKREIEEETGLLVRPSDFRLVAIFGQALGGDVTLYETLKWEGEIRVTRPEEISWAGWMSFTEIVEKKDEFPLGYFRLILRYMRYVNMLDPTPFKGKLSDPVEYAPWGLRDRDQLVVR